MKISVGQALLILLDKYRNNPECYSELKHLYLAGAKNEERLHAIEQFLTDPILTRFEISKEAEIINHDSSRRYFETHLAYETLASQLQNFSIEELNTHVHMVKKSAPFYYTELYDYVLNGNYRDDTEHEYVDYFRKLKDKEIFSAFSDEQREKIAALVIAAFVAVIIASNGPHLLPLNIYEEGIFLQKGKKLKSNQNRTTTSAFGLLQSKDAVYLDDPARMLKIQNFLKPSEQATYNINAPWVKNNFSQLVHPFSNSISGTILCQLRVLLKIKELPAQIPQELLSIREREEELFAVKEQMNAEEYRIESEELEKIKKNIEEAIAILSKEAIFSSSEKLRSFFALYISALLFNAGGHTLHEFTASICLEQVKRAFADAHIDGFDTLDLEELFLNNNQEAFDHALAKAIHYNNQMIKRAAVHQELWSEKKAFDKEVTPILINESKLPLAVKKQFLVFADHDEVGAGDYLKLAEKLQLIVSKNEERVSSEYFSFYRQGAQRQIVLTNKLNNAIVELSHGNPGEATTIIKEAIDELSIYNSSNKPELTSLMDLYKVINSYVDAASQMTPNKS